MKYRTLRSIVRFFMKIITDIEVNGIEKLPEGNVIVAANHLGRLDTAALLCILDREDIIMPVAEKYRDHPLYGAIGRAANAVWLNRFEADYSAFRQILERIGDARFVLLGEASHGTHEFYRERARITQRLIEKKGLRRLRSRRMAEDWIR